ncbi:hypothetical protein TYRP_016549 [Tyrophagus putrescentiae]|nr:hypothetical protein TYRP_016549 [Tyrophagus putrescentiae]
MLAFWAPFRERGNSSGVAISTSRSAMAANSPLLGSFALSYEHVCVCLTAGRRLFSVVHSSSANQQQQQPHRRH